MGKRIIKCSIQYGLHVLPLTLLMAIDNTLNEIHRDHSVHLWWEVLGFSIFWGGGSILAGTFLFSPLLFPLSIVWDNNHLNRVRAECARSLEVLRQAESISVLASTIFDSSPQVRKASFEALSSVLPTLESSDYGQFDGSITMLLCKLLKDSDEHFVVQVMEALGKVGSGKAVPHVTRLAEKSYSLVYKKQHNIYFLFS